VGAWLRRFLVFAGAIALVEVGRVMQVGDVLATVCKHKGDRCDGDEGGEGESVKSNTRRASRRKGPS
jgi:hypothetical protein